MILQGLVERALHPLDHVRSIDVEITEGRDDGVEEEGLEVEGSNSHEVLRNWEQVAVFPLFIFSILWKAGERLVSSPPCVIISAW